MLLGQRLLEHVDPGSIARQCCIDDGETTTERHDIPVELIDLHLGVVLGHESTGVLAVGDFLCDKCPLIGEIPRVIDLEESGVPEEKLLDLVARAVAELRIDLIESVGCR